VALLHSGAGASASGPCIRTRSPQHPNLSVPVAKLHLPPALPQYDLQVLLGVLTTSYTQWPQDRPDPQGMLK
jgi:hypothetical protein